MGLLIHRRLAIPLSALTVFVVAVTAPAAVTLLPLPPTTGFVVAALGITAIVFLTPRAIPFLRASRSRVRVPPSKHHDRASLRITVAGGVCARTLEEPNRSAAHDALDLVRMDDDGGWQMARPPG